MSGFDFKKLMPHGIAILVFIIISAVYFSPELQGKRIQQSDIANFKGMSKEIRDYREQTGEEPYWTNSMFGGMPAYQISVLHPQPLMKYLDVVFKMGVKNGMGTLFLYLIGFYILMVVLKVDPVLGVIGSIAFAFSSYFFIILEVGHTSKAYAIGYMPAVLAGFLMLFRNREYLWGTIVTAIFFGLQVYSGHPQITYYLGIAIICIGIFYLVDSIKNGAAVHLLKASGLFIVACALGAGMSASKLMSTAEYAEATTRGPSELSPPAEGNKTSGLDKDYATAWSYGVGESWTLLVPNFLGGGSGAIGNDKDVLEAVSRPNRQTISRGVDRYWGDQPFTSGPVYAGAAVFLLCILGLWYVKGPLKWGLLMAGILTLMLSWGKNLMPLTEFFLESFPIYNKFRAVSMILVIVELAVPVLAILGLNELVKKKDEVKKNMNVFYALSGVVAAVLLFMLVSPGVFTDFFKSGEQANLATQLEGAGYKPAQVDSLIVDIENARRSIFSGDVTRSLIVVLLAFAMLWAMITDKIKSKYAVIGIGVIIIADMWSVDQRYLNKESFVSKRKIESPFTPSPADQQILKDPDPYFRVYNTTRRLDQDGQTSYFHKSLGGYHGAKLGRYQELIDRQLSKNNIEVINMLNAKYVIQQGQDGQLSANRNPSAMGNAWFINEIQVVEDADAEMAVLDILDVRSEAVMDVRFEEFISKTSWPTDSASSIVLTEYEPNLLRFDVSTSNEAFVVFSDIYYQPGWISTIDGVEKSHVRVNYVLRGIEIPSGNHKIEFRFDPKVISLGNTLNHVSSLLLVLLIIGGVVITKRRKTEA